MKTRRGHKKKKLEKRCFVLSARWMCFLSVVPKQESMMMWHMCMMMWRVCSLSVEPKQESVMMWHMCMMTWRTQARERDRGPRERAQPTRTTLLFFFRLGLAYVLEGSYLLIDCNGTAFVCMHVRTCATHSIENTFRREHIL